MRIGELADKAGVNIQTVRYYERRSILPAPTRTASGYRSYSDHDLSNLRFIRQSQELGFTLAEIRQLLVLHNSLASQHLNWRKSPRAGDFGKLARVKIGQIDQKIRFLRRMRSQLADVIRDVATAPGCPGSKSSR